MSLAKRPDPRTVSQIESEAAAWIVRMEGDVTPEERERFNAWRKESPRHEAACRRLETVWSRAAVLHNARPPEAGIDADLLKPSRPRWIAPLRWAAAAMVPIVAVAAVVWISILPLAGDSYVTASHSERHLLQDGSEVMLSPSSHVRVRMTNAGRVVDMDLGAARFSVSKDERHRPFDVFVAQAVLRAKGTVFSVRREDDQRLEMEVTEGSVAVARLGTEAQLGREDLPWVIPTVGAGERVRVTPEAILIFPTAERRLDLRGRALADVVREFNLFYKVPLRIIDPTLADLPMTGRPRALNRAAFLERLAELHIGTQDRGNEIALFKLQ